MALMAEFKTAWNQREVRIDATLAADLKVGQVCTYNTGTKALAAATALAAGNVIIAQSDMTMGKNRFIDPVTGHDYEHKYSDVVKASTTAKPVMVFVVNDVTDITTRTV